MTNWEKIKSMTEREFAEWLCNCTIPDDPNEEMYIMYFGRFRFVEDVIDMLRKE